MRCQKAPAKDKSGSGGLTVCCDGLSAVAFLLIELLPLGVALVMGQWGFPSRSSTTDILFMGLSFCVMIPFIKSPVLSALIQHFKMLFSGIP